MFKKWYLFIILSAVFPPYFYLAAPYCTGTITELNPTSLTTGGIMGSVIITMKGEGNLFIEICEDKQCADTEIFTLKGETAEREYQIIPTAGIKNYTFNLYGGNRFLNRELQDTKNVEIWIYTQEELSDNDRDKLPYYQELEKGTDPDNPDTDYDGITDDKDPFPLMPTTSLNIPDNHNQEVYIDGVYAGKTPLFLPYVPTGNHTVVIRNNEANLTYDMTLIANVPHTTGLSLKKEKPQEKNPQKSQVSTYTPEDKYVYFLTNPQGAEVYIDEVLRGSTPLVLESSPESHPLTIRKQGYREYNAAIELKAGRKIAVTLERE